MSSAPGRLSCISICPPVGGGVSDFAATLEHEVNSDENLRIRMTRQEVSEGMSFFPGRPANVALIQYSGYGYAKRGAPLWILDEVADWQKEGTAIGVFFHELFALGPPWRSSFWLSPVQRHVASRLAILSSFWITNRELSGRWLRRVAADKPSAVLPVFSSVGEQQTISIRRNPKVVVFGAAGTRHATYCAGGSALFAWIAATGLELHDIGPPLHDPTVRELFATVPHVLHGRLESEHVDAHLSDAMFGLVAYPASYVAKSSVFAAYCAHGVCPILLCDRYEQADGLVPGEHYLPGVPMIDEQMGSRECIAARAWQWYQPHRLAEHVRLHALLIRKAGRSVA
jgi:hypothetical protein